MRNLLNLFLILATALNQFVVLGALPARPANPTAQPAAATAPVVAPFTAPDALVPAAPVAEPVLEARFPKPPKPDPVFSEESAQQVRADGGEISGLDGQVKMRFGEDTLPEAADLWIAPVDQEHMPAKTLSGKPFQVVARGKNSQKAIHQFKQKATIELSYDPQTLVGDESTLLMYYYAEDNEQWRPLPSWVDTQRHVLIATTDHLTVFDANAIDWQAARLPDLKGWQVSNFTGAGTYEYPFQLPPGPGGFQPELKLSYNSQVVDQAQLIQQASSQGMGWTLSGGYIDRNISNDTFSLVLNGASYALLKVDTPATTVGDFTVTTYRTADDNFWRLQFYSREIYGRPDTNEKSYWKVWDTAGTFYEFGANWATTNELGCSTDCDAARIPRVWWETVDVPAPPHEVARIRNVIWRWGLTRTRNAFDKTIEYFYDVPLKQVEFPYYLSPFVGTGMYPNRIVYPNQKYRVVFNYGQRQDLDPAWESGPESRLLYNTKKLDSIAIQNNTSTNPAAPTWVTVRGYTLRYNEDNQNIFPNYTWPAFPGSTGAKTLTLTSIAEFYMEGTVVREFPVKTSFKYDGMHLIEGNNGYGGKVNLDYSDVWHGANGSEAIFKAKNYEVSFTDWYGAVTYDIGFKYDKTFHPGGYYLVEADVHSYRTTNICIGHIYNTTTYQCDLFAGNLRKVLTKVVFVDKNATQFSPALYCAPPADETQPCHLFSLKITYLPTYYRVKSKTLTDTVQNKSQAYTYSYQGAALNDRAHSAAISTCYNPDGSTPVNVRCVTPQYAEFRGNMATTETGPDGRSTTTWFHQDDERTGRAFSSQTMQRAFYDNFSDLNSSNWYTYPNSGTAYGVEAVTGDSALKIYSSADDKMAWMNRLASSVGRGKPVQFQFYVDAPAAGVSPRVYFYIRNGGNPPSQWGLRLQNHKLTSTFYLNGQPQSEVDLITNFKYGRWYEVELVAASERLWVSVKDRDDPSSEGRYEIVTPAEMKGALYFAAEVRASTVRVDGYRENNLYLSSETQYTSTNNLVATLPPQWNDNGNTYNYTVTPSIGWRLPG